VDVVHFRPRTIPPTIAVELPNGTAQVIPVGWTSRATPTIDQMIGLEGVRLSVVVLVEITEWVRKWGTFPEDAQHKNNVPW
jgi:hypothetical protein